MPPGSSDSFNKMCFSDIITIVDRMCSGRTACEFAVNTLVLETEPCPMELRSYLQASYICIPGKKLWYDILIINNIITRQN